MNTISTEEIFVNVRKEMKRRIKENMVELLQAESVDTKIISKMVLEPLGYKDWERQRLDEINYYTQMGTDRNNIVFYNDGGQKLLVCFVTYQKITHVVEKDICRMLNDNNIEWGILTDGNTLGYVITTYHKGAYCIPNAGTINAIFAKLKNSKKEYEVFTPQYIRSSLPEALLREGFALEEICYLMNIKVSNISNYISQKVY